MHCSTMYLKAFEQTSHTRYRDFAVNLYLPDKAIWPSTQPNQSPIEANKSTNESSIEVTEANQSNKVLLEAQTNYQSLLKVANT